MKQNLLSKAKSLGCEIYQDSRSKWIIRGLRGKETLLIKEQESNTWLITCQEIPISFLKTEIILEFLNILTKKEKFNNKEKLMAS